MGRSERSYFIQHLIMSILIRKTRLLAPSPLVDLNSTGGPEPVDLSPIPSVDSYRFPGHCRYRLSTGMYKELEQLFGWDFGNWETSTVKIINKTHDDEM